MSESQVPVPPEQPTPAQPTPPPPAAPYPAMPPYQPPSPYSPMPAYQPPMPGTGKPGQVTAIAIMDLVDGIINCLAGTIWCLTLFGIPIGAYAITVGILEIVYAAKILPDPIKVATPARYVAIMQIINIISLNVVSLVAGILSLVFYSDAHVMQYFESRRGQVW